MLKKINKSIAMMRGNSPPSEYVLEKIKSNNSLYFAESLNREIIYLFFVEIVVFIHVYLISNDKNLAK